jgi:outer membrane immunogenic protein
MKLALVSAAAASILALAAIPVAASAQTTQWSGYYGNLGYTGTDVTNGGANLGSVTGRFGWKSNQFWGLEVEGSAGVQHDTVGGVKENLNDQFAGYGTVTVPLANHFDVFARVGYGQTRINSTPKGSGGTDNSLNYGAGAEWFFDNKNGIRGDYTRENFQQGGGDADVWSASYVHRF